MILFIFSFFEIKYTFLRLILNIYEKMFYVLFFIFSIYESILYLLIVPVILELILEMPIKSNKTLSIYIEGTLYVIVDEYKDIFLDFLQITTLRFNIFE